MLVRMLFLQVKREDLVNFLYKDKLMKIKYALCGMLVMLPVICSAQTMFVITKKIRNNFDPLSLR